MSKSDILCFIYFNIIIILMCGMFGKILYEFDREQAATAEHTIVTETVIQKETEYVVTETIEYRWRDRESAESLSEAVDSTSETVSETITTDPVEIVSDADMGEYIGTYDLTAYIETGNPCADGVYPSVGYTVACNNPSLWHRWIYIDGVGERYVHDTGGMGGNVIDVYVGDYDSAVQFGRRSGDVYLLR